MPPKSRRNETPTGASTSDDTDVCPLQQCGNCSCPTRSNRNIMLQFVEVQKYSDWGSDRPWICQTCTFRQCTPCGSAYSSLRGLSLHLRRSHEERYNQGEAEREVRKVRWDDGDNWTSLIFGEEVTDENVVIDQGVLDTSLERLFPAVRKVNSGGANRQEVDLGDPSVTLTSHRRRRRLYKRVQRMFCRDPKRLMSGILQDSLEVKDSIPEGAEEFWTELLGRESPVDVAE
ncbi:hypothetical protein EB796_024746 [Bugula neritina]|uniref:C2H2-type domain-containing protein n=1 Tax=Bugula neritina TaxID=10212 RepID=A0A7J7ITP0_BUGNE|nr:hypothetical protein EB796_024746 [Bugula neritina]